MGISLSLFLQIRTDSELKVLKASMDIYRLRVYQVTEWGS